MQEIDSPLRAGAAAAAAWWFRSLAISLAQVSIFFAAARFCVENNEQSPNARPNNYVYLLVVVVSC